MELHVLQGDIAQTAADCVVVNLFEGVTQPGGATGALDSALDGAISSLIGTGDFTGEAGTTALLYTYGKVPAPRVLLVGLGKQEKFDLHSARKAAAVAARALAKLKKVSHFATNVHVSVNGVLDTQVSEQVLA